ncbi:hypothetical protein D3C81_1575670 [compost metagenome]
MLAVTPVSAVFRLILLTTSVSVSVAAVVIVVVVVPTLRTRLSAPPPMVGLSNTPAPAIPTVVAEVLPALLVPNLPAAPVTPACRVARPPATLASL